MGPQRVLNSPGPKAMGPKSQGAQFEVVKKGSVMASRHEWTDLLDEKVLGLDVVMAGRHELNWVHGGIGAAEY